MPDDFDGYFFSLSTAELLVAQSLGEQFRFAFVNTSSGHVSDRTLRRILQQTKSIYPSWNIRLCAPVTEGPQVLSTPSR